MFISYDNKKNERDILKNTPKAVLKIVSGSGAVNKLIQGDNLSVLKTLLDDYAGRIDLVYIDPPFSTNGHFKIGPDRANTISSSRSDTVAYSDTLIGADFLEFLRQRLIFLRELLSKHGSIYLHIDYKVGHYVKLIMDEIFGCKNFRNDITRIKCNPKNFHRRAYGNIKDLLLFYSKSERPIWNNPPQYPMYPTEKNLDLLKFIVDASSNQGSIVLDCFCGSGTTLVAAQLLNRNWIGIDRSEQAIKVAQKKMAGIPANLFSKSGFEFLTETSGHDSANSLYRSGPSAEPVRPSSAHGPASSAQKRSLSL